MSAYRWSLLLPYVVPAALTPLMVLDASLPPELREGIEWLGVAALGGAIPYTILAIGLLGWTRGRSEGELRKAMLAAPWQMAGVMVVLYVLPALFSSPAPTAREVAVVLCCIVGLSLGTGYVYVGLARGLVALLRRCGCVEPVATNGS